MAGHVGSMDMKGHFLVNLGQFKQQANLKSLEYKNVHKNSKRAFVWVPHTIIV